MRYNNMSDVEDENNSAKVYDIRYRSLNTPLSPPNSLNAAYTMSIFEIKRGLRGTWPKVPLILAGFIVFGFLIQMNSFLSEDAVTFWIGNIEENGPPIGIRISLSSMLMTMDGPGAIIILHIAVVSAGLISGDLKDRAIELYFSKISILSYFLSKLIASFFLTLIGLPLFAIFYYLIAIYKRLALIEDLTTELSSIFEISWKLLLTVFVVVLFLSILILVFSAFTSNAVNAGVSFVVFTLVSRVFFEAILFDATNIDLFYALSPINAIDVIRRAILEPDDVSDQFLSLSIITTFMYTILSVTLILLKLYREKNK